VGAASGALAGTGTRWASPSICALLLPDQELDGRPATGREPWTSPALTAAGTFLGGATLNLWGTHARLSKVIQEPAKIILSKLTLACSYARQRHRQDAFLGSSRLRLSRVASSIHRRLRSREGCVEAWSRVCAHRKAVVRRSARSLPADSRAPVHRGAAHRAAVCRTSATRPSNSCCGMASALKSGAENGPSAAHRGPRHTLHSVHRFAAGIWRRLQRRPHQRRGRSH